MSKPYALFSIENFTAGITDEDHISINLAAEYRPMESLDLSTSERRKSSLEYKPITAITINYVEGTALNNEMITSAKKFIERYLIIVAIEKQVAMSHPTVKCECYTAGADENNREIHVSDSISIRDEIVFTFPTFGANSYNSFADNLLCDNVDDVQDDLDILHATFNAESTEAKYLLQYEFLEHLVAELYGSRSSQKNVKKFVLEKYNPSVQEFERLSERIARNNPSVTQDSLSFYRNVIGHPPTEEESWMQGIDVGATIVAHSRKLNEVILFAIREKHRLNGATY